MDNLTIKVVKNGCQTLSDGKKDDEVVYEAKLLIPAPEKATVVLSRDSTGECDIIVTNKPRKSFVKEGGSMKMVKVDSTSMIEQTANNKHPIRNDKIVQTSVVEDLDPIQVENLTDKDLYRKLKSFNVDVGPIVDSTRSMYQNKLVGLMQKKRKSMEKSSLLDVYEIPRSLDIEDDMISKKRAIQCEHYSDDEDVLDKNSFDEDQSNVLIDPKNIACSIRGSTLANITFSPAHQGNGSSKQEVGSTWKTISYIGRLIATLLKIIMLTCLGLIIYYVVFDSE